jgi:hypothetical protein
VQASCGGRPVGLGADSIKEPVKVIRPRVERFKGARKGFVEFFVGKGMQAGAALLDPLLTGNEDHGRQEMLEVQTIKRIPGIIVLSLLCDPRQPASLVDQAGQSESSRPGGPYSRIAPIAAAWTER